MHIVQELYHITKALLTFLEINTQLFITLWLIWKERSEAIFACKTPNPLGILTGAKTYTSELIETMKKAPESLILRTPITRPVSLWRPPRDGFIKINSDANFIAQFGRVFGGVIIQHGEDGFFR